MRKMRQFKAPPLGSFRLDMTLRFPHVSASCKFQFSDEFVFRDKGVFAGGMIEERTVKICAQRYGWNVGTVVTTASQDWKGETYVGCPKYKLPHNWKEPLTE